MVNRNDLIVRASDLASHNGYQQWHRDYNNEVVNWLTGVGQKSTVAGFKNYLNDIYSAPDMVNRFPTAIDTIENVLGGLK